MKDTAPDVIPQSMQLIAGRTAQDYNQRKARKGAFWEDRYHATAIEGGEHLHRCLVYIDLNMVRAGVVKHPAEWVHSGYREIQAPPERYAVIDIVTLSALTGFASVASFQNAHHEWVEEALSGEIGARDERWSETIAVGGREYVHKVRAELGNRAAHRRVAEIDGVYALREPCIPYAHDFEGKNDVLRPENTFSWNEIAETTGA